MLTIILLFLLLSGVLIGLRRGFILQVLHLTGFIIAFIVAARYYSSLASKLEMWIPYPNLLEDSDWSVFLSSFPLEGAFYNAIAFGTLFFVTKIILQIIATMLDFIADLPFIRFVNGGLGALLGFLEVYLIAFIILFIIALAPIPFIQSMIDQSSLATFMIEKTPVLSEKMMTYWFENNPFSN
ncbi:putative membrane protein required for colicin V production [Gracilibacillus halotolerans]|uniref:Putative membrane protein required for colicin V production n=1 Tax=Gracilibacillus halotolerans TaxID=74386 RepID=A0A841RM72_9BACI|nr:CvpA family protein [Gracilibacillus halotolerans]MBB6513871.1 putative membrane protein required for colicin V production [Gracilibacillus halotolerans]